MSTEATPAAAPVENANTPAPESQGAPATPPAKPEGDKSNDTPTLDEAMAQVNLDHMNESQVADLESGDPARIAKALGLDSPAPKNDDAAPASNNNAPANNGEDAPERVSIKALPTAERAKLVKALASVRSGKAPAEAFAEAFGVTPQQAPAANAADPDGEANPAPAQQQQPETPTQSKPFAAKVTELETKLATLRAEYESKRAEYDPTAQDTLAEMQDVKLDLRDAKREAEQEAREEQAWMSEQAASHQRAMSQYADLITESPDFLEYCEAEIVLAERKNDPVMSRPDWPENIAKRVSEKYFNGKAANSSASAKDSYNPIPPAPNQRVRIPGSPVGPAFAPGTLTTETALAEFDKLTPEQQEAAMQEIAKLTSKSR